MPVENELGQGQHGPVSALEAFRISLPDWLMEYTSGSALNKMFKGEGGMELVAAYLFSHRLIQVDFTLLRCEQKLEKAVKELNELACRCAELKLRAGLAEDKVKKLEPKLESAELEARTAEALNMRFDLFLDDVGTQIDNYGVVDIDSYGAGRRWALSNEREGVPFKPDGIPATDRAERAYKRRLIRKLAQRAGMRTLGKKKKK